MNRAHSLIELKSVDTEQRIIRGWATRPEVDRVGDVIAPGAVTAAASIPLLLYHDSTQCVGRATLGRSTAQGVPFEARIPDVSEPGPLQDRVRDAWSMVRHGLITAVSVGFRVLNDAAERIPTGWRFDSIEVLELSLVPIPACPGAVIESWKSHATPAQREAIVRALGAGQRSGSKHRVVKLVKPSRPGVRLLVGGD